MPRLEIVPLSLPNGDVLACFVGLEEAISGLVQAALTQDGEAIAKGLLGPAQVPDCRKLELWAVQRATSRDSSINWDSLDDGLLDSSTPLKVALGLATDHAVHLREPLLRLVYLPLCLRLSFSSVPDVPEQATALCYFGRCMTASDVLLSVVDQFRLRKTIQQGTKTADIQYILRLVQPDHACDSQDAFFGLLERFLLPGPPFEVEVTLSPEWLTKVGTIATGLLQRLPTRTSVRTAAWRPSSMFSLWNSPVAEDENLDEAQDTIKAPGPPKSTPSHRLSSFFDWSSSEAEPYSKHTVKRSVSNPVPVSQQRPLLPLIGPTGPADEVYSLASDQEDLETEFEDLISNLGIKEAQQTAMRQLSDDRKRFLIQQQKTLHKLPPWRSQPNGPVEVSSGTFQSLKRFSLAAIGVGSEIGLASSTTKTHSPASSVSSLSLSASASWPAQQTASGWSSWFTSPGAGAAPEESPVWFVQELSRHQASGKASTKVLIGLRVRLSTEPLSWIEEFVDHCAGVTILCGLLKRDSDLDSDENLRLECVKCLRVLLNTQVGFSRVLDDTQLVAQVAFCLHATSIKLRSIVAETLAALCVLSSQGGHRSVLAALSDFRVEFKEPFRFEHLLESIKPNELGNEAEADDANGLWHYRTAVLGLVNAIVNSPKEIEERVQLREEFARRGFNEVMTSLKYCNPPDALQAQFQMYLEERMEDQEELRARHHKSPSHPDFPELIEVVAQNRELYPALLDMAKRYTSVLGRDVGPSFREKLLIIMGNFIDHIARLEDADRGWVQFMREYLKSLQHIVGQHVIVTQSGQSDAASVPTSFFNELESLRTQIEQLHTENKLLKSQLQDQLAESATFRTLHVDEDGSEEALTGVIHRLVVKEKQVLQLQEEIDQLSKMHKLPKPDALKQEMYEKTRQWSSLLDEIGALKAQLIESDGSRSSAEKESQYLRRSLEAVYLKFQTKQADDSALATNADDLVSKSIAAVAARDHTITQLTSEVESLKTQLRQVTTNIPRARIKLSDLQAHMHLPTRQAPPPPTPSTSAESDLVSPPKQSTAFNSDVPPPPPPPPLSSTSKTAPCSPAPPPPAPPPPPPIPGPPRTGIPAIVQPAIKLRPLHWTKVNADNTIWKDVTMQLLDVEAIQAAFAVPIKAQKSAASSSLAQTKTLLAINRANNIGVLLARTKLSIEGFVAAFVSMDEKKLTLNMLQTLKQNAPIAEERTAIQNYRGDFSALSRSDRFMKEMLQVPRYLERTACMIFKRRFDLELEEIKPDLNILRAAHDEMRSSGQLKMVLGVILAIGNALNASTFRGNAAGFQLGTLLQLADIKSNDRSSLLHFVVKQLVQQNLTAFIAELPHVEAASRISFSSLKETAAQLQSGLAQIREELSATQAQDRFQIAMDLFLNQATPATSALKQLLSSLDTDLRDLLVYYGEDPATCKTEELFSTIVSFSSSVTKIEEELAETERRKARMAKPGRLQRSVGKGDFDQALRRVQTGQAWGSMRRQEREDQSYRPLSRIFPKP